MSETLTASSSSVAGTSPSGSVTPSSLSELQEVLRTYDGATFAPVGGGTMLERGRPPIQPFKLLHLGKATGGDIEHQSDDLTVVVPAGVTISALNEQLAAKDQWVPLDPPHPLTATVGGTVSTGMNGPLRTRFGLPRDLVLGMTVMRADGVLVKAGGRVVKNVTGYDLMRLWCGAHGTLGIVTEVALRALPRVPTVTLRAHYESITQLASAARKLSTDDIRPEIADAFPDGNGWTFVVRVAESAVAGATRTLHDPNTVADDALYTRSRDLGAGPATAMTLNASTTLGRVAQLAASVQAMAPTDCVVRPLAGVVRAAWAGDAIPPAERMAHDVDALRAQVSEVQGAVTIDRMPAAYHAAIDPWGEPPGSHRVMQNVKAAYDPDGRLNRGRFIGGI